MLLAFLVLGEKLSAVKVICMLLIGIGTYFMITKKQSDNETKGWGWLWYAVLSAVFASLTSILGKIGISEIDSNLGTAIRTIVVLIMAWLMVFVTGKQSEIKAISKRNMLVTIAFSYFVLKEKLTKKSMIGLVLITAGTLLLVK